MHPLELNVIIHYMSERYEIDLGDLNGHSPEYLGNFAISFVVKPPIDILSDQSRTELGSHVINTINALQPGIPSVQETNGSIQSNHAKASFTHELPNSIGTLGTISGSIDEGQISREVIQRALSIVLNGDKA